MVKTTLFVIHDIPRRQYYKLLEYDFFRFAALERNVELRVGTKALEKYQGQDEDDGQNGRRHADLRFGPLSGRCPRRPPQRRRRRRF